VVILLHGFPEFWYGWRGQIAPLASAGFRVVVPDQRGYNQSSKPQGWQAYTVPNLVGDVLGIADRLERQQFMLAGHDWGGVIAWACAMGHQDRVSRLGILNAPHPSVFGEYARTHPAQLLRSWYIFFMQLPWLPEFLFEAQNFQAMTEALTKSSRPGTSFLASPIRDHAFFEHAIPRPAYLCKASLQPLRDLVRVVPRAA